MELKTADVAMEGRRSRQQRPGGLTPRQHDILKLVAHGHTNREIAELLGLSVRTVEVHRFNLMRRLGASNVAQLLRLALKRRLLSKSSL